MKGVIHLRIDLTGQRFGKLTALKNVGVDKHGNAIWLCRCDCGNESNFTTKDLRSGNSKSCGCYLKEFAVTHGMTDDVDYERWKSMKKRCSNPKNKYYKDYGGRGIKVFPKWVHDFQAFKTYISSLPHYGEPGRTLDRKNNDGNYEPGNLRWATASEQAKNRR